MLQVYMDIDQRLLRQYLYYIRLALLQVWLYKCLDKAYLRQLHSDLFNRHTQLLYRQAFKNPLITQVCQHFGYVGRLRLLHKLIKFYLFAIV
jgi:hypothetical protein